MTKPISTRTQNIAASLTVAIDTMAKQMIADGKDVASRHRNLSVQPHARP